MIDERRFELEARLYAIEWLLTRTLSFQLSMFGPDRAEAVAAEWRSQMDAMTIPEYPPEVSDAFAATVRDRVEEILEPALQNMRAGYERFQREQ
jgi:hypothetical protein